MTALRDDSAEMEALRVAVDAWAEEYKALYVKHGEGDAKSWCDHETILNAATDWMTGIERQSEQLLDALAEVLREAFERKMGG